MDSVTKVFNTKGPLNKTLQEYGNATSIHGIPYILEDGRLLFERALWALLFILGAFVSSFLTYRIYTSWDENPISTNLGTTEYDIENLDYPSITICAQGSVKEIIGNQHLSQKLANTQKVKKG